MPDLRPGADVNLLFGILALQLDFINREQLIAAMSAWAFDKSRSLSAILLEQGLLDAERHALLQALVEQRLKMHADNPHRSIAALNNVGELRQELDRLGASATQGTFTHVSSTPGKNETPAAAGDDPYATRSGRTQAATGERFRIVRPHARGGLGEVFVALDQELNREVALKEIQERHADNPDSRARFLLEAEVTGGLEHPGIVPVYALGKYEDGRPYYAMRFIRGDSLKDAIDRFHDKQTAPRDPHERALALRNLLRRFVDVCQAIQYAHDRGILHRDLKPSNIMVGRYGETLVVDWGLAKAVDAPEPATASIEPPLRPSTASGSAETVAGSALGTPQFMSPEQAAGQLTLLGPASDVYSLGATLYYLLAGRAPFGDNDVDTTLRRVQRGDFPRPRLIKPDVPPALEAICLKAMTLKPRDRYGRPRDLADEIENWLADEPVSVWPEPWTQRLARWGRHHRAWAEALVGIFVFAILAASGAAFWQRQQAAQEREARVAAEELQEKGLRVAARYAARTLAYEIDLRWWILKGAADDAELRRLLRDLAKVEDPGEHPSCLALHAWVKDRYRESMRTRATSWFIAGPNGRHLSRFPLDEKLVGRDFAFRDYFHGEGQDYPEGTRKKPITDVHRSLVFVSQATDHRMVAFSVPIWSGEPGKSECLGVLSMTVELGEFAGLQLDPLDAMSGARKDRVAVLVDTRADGMNGQAQRGLILQHPALTRIRKTDKLPELRLDADQLERIDRIRRNRMQRTPALTADDLDRAYHDPAGGDYAGVWRAAFAPVLIDDRPTKIKDTGWVVILQER